MQELSHTGGSKTHGEPCQWMIHTVHPGLLFWAIMQFWKLCPCIKWF